VSFCSFYSQDIFLLKKMNSFRFAAIQLASGADKALNLQRAANLVARAASDGAKVVSLPECFNSPYGAEYFKPYAEKIPEGESCRSLAKMAQENKIYLIGGSIPEADGDNLYNTCTIWGPNGDLIGKHRKVHLFDIDVPGKIRFQESETLSPGSSYTTIDTPFCKIGVAICYDLRFAEMAKVYAQKGCKVLVYPGAFNMTTGPPHWELLLRARAVDNQVYVVGASPARCPTAHYVAWGHSAIVNPWGTIIAETDEKEGIAQADIDLNFLEDVRNQIPISKQKRLDMYETVEKFKKSS
ncbi:hypothetical protein QYM36_012084, partial [Artemia franciscana]